MNNLPVNWSEGMFLRPHHFQAAERYWTEFIQTSQRWSHANDYGLHAIELSDEAIANYQVQVTKCHARMKDGTLIALDLGQEPDRVDLKEAVQALSDSTKDLQEAFEAETTIRVYLAVPKLKMGRRNLGGSEASGDFRYVDTRLSLQDENLGGNDQEIDFRSLNVRLLLSTEDLSGYEILPIAQIQRVGEADTAPQLDRDYIPPLLTVEAWPELSTHIIREIYDYMGSHLTELTTELSRISKTGLDPSDFDQVLRLVKLNEAYTTLGCVTFASGVHPWVAYLELCRIVGMLAIFTERLHVDDIPHYDHDNLAYVFGWLKSKIIEIVRGHPKLEYERRDFVSDEMQRLHVTLESRWLHDDWDWYVGVDPGGISEQDCRDLLKPGLINWKLGSKDKVDIYVRLRAAGLKLVSIDRVPRPLPVGGPWLYYRVDRDRDDQAWQAVQESKTLAIRFEEGVVSDVEEKKISLERGGKSGELRFALFAVPQR